ncbi:hypothetical protein PSAC2689_90329 [Paraburkholderia sacchari]|uniref:helix-turn-helix transcriptional regulator n=1 Tax=Paraburkholderia sacchari TaxID=159450 RepID=UPI0039A5704A
MPTATPAVNDTSQLLPPSGWSRLAKFKHLLPFSEDQFRRWGKEGRAPQPVRLSHKCAVYSNDEVTRFLADLANYRAGTPRTQEQS